MKKGACVPQFAKVSQIIQIDLQPVKKTCEFSRPVKNPLKKIGWKLSKPVKNLTCEISTHKLGDVGISSNLISSLSLAN